MKKYNIVEEIALDMHSNKKLMPEDKYVVSDEEILKKTRTAGRFGANRQGRKNSADKCCSL